MYRHDGARSGATAAQVPSNLAPAWVLKVGGRLTPPVVALNKVFVATPQTCEVHAFDAADGKRSWRFAADAGVDSPPSIIAPAGDPASALCVFGCHDGCVYAVRVVGGELAWRFRLAPKKRWVSCEGRIESAWPIPGSVLIQDGLIHAVAGRSSFLDGGLWAGGLDPGSGRPKYEKRLYDLAMTKGRDGFNATYGALNDILVGDGSGMRLGRARLGEGPAKVGLFATSGFLDDTFFNRSWWALSENFPYYTRSPETGPRGQLLVFSDSGVYGVRVFRRVSKLGGRSADFSPGEGYEVFAMRAEVAVEAAAQAAKASPKPAPASQDIWKENLPIRVQAMTLAGTSLFIAGAPDVLDARDPLGAFEGRMGGKLKAFSAADGRKLGACDLSSAPVFDGMAAAGGRLYLSLMDGSILCLAGSP